MENTQVSSDTKLKSFPYLHYRSDNFRFHVSKPIWLLGFGFHGPHTPSNVNLHNLKIHIEVLDEDSPSDHRHSKLLANRTKECRVKIPRVVLPIFFDKPVKIWSSSKTGYFNYHKILCKIDK